MPGVVVVGAQWGDEGKGKIVDLLTERADVVVRYAGGPNAGHTLVVGNDKVIVRLVPSGILRPSTTCVLAQGMVVDPARLLGEIDELEKRGYAHVTGALRLSERAHTILPYHVLVDQLREAGPHAIGTTKRGVGPCYEDKVGRRGLQLGTLRDWAKTRAVVAQALEAWAPTIAALGGTAPTVDAVLAELEPMRARLLPLLADTARLVERAVRDGKRVLFEGAQGTLLDIDHGTYPFVTSSSATSGGACTGSGVGPTRIDAVVGLVKAYCTRVGDGPFPTELLDATGDRLRNVGQEFGSVTGRPRRTGWLDLPALRYAARVNGLDGMALTKLDVLTGLAELRVCTQYRTKGGALVDEIPLDEVATCEPVYETLPGWSEPLQGARTLADLPATARSYVRFVEEQIGVPAWIVSVGVRRDETVVTHDPLA
jgi:adenylosuccinate synthase